MRPFRLLLPAALLLGASVTDLAAECGGGGSILPPRADNYPYETIAASDAEQVLSDRSAPGSIVLDGAWSRYDAGLATLKGVPLVQGPGYRTYERTPGGLLVESPPQAEIRDRHGNVIRELTGNEANPSQVVRAGKQPATLSQEFAAAQTKLLAAARVAVEKERDPATTLLSLAKLRALGGFPEISEEAGQLHDGLLAAGQRKVQDAQALSDTDARKGRRALAELQKDYAGTAIAEAAAVALSLAKQGS